MWDLDFINKNDFKNHVKQTIEKYGEKLQPINLRKFNKNLIDPIKMIFDKNIYNLTWEEIINSEIARQRDKSNNNDIGYFHQKIFQYISNCTVPNEGWDVIYTSNNGIEISKGKKVSKIYVEMKNKHNTMNSAAAGKTFIKMQSQLLDDDDCACFLVEAIAQKSQNIKWETTVDKKKVGHNLIRRVSIDEFYSIVTGDREAFHKICEKLPIIIKEVISEGKDLVASKDTVIDELIKMTENMNMISEEMAIQTAILILGFGSYIGFDKNK